MTLFATLLISLASLLMEEAKASIVFAGDAMQHQSQLDAARSGQGYDYSGYFTEIEPYISAADYAVVNLETPIGHKGFSGYPMFCAPWAFAESLRDAGFDLFLTANNHTLDRRDRGLRQTIQLLDSLGVDHTGTYVSPEAKKKYTPLIRDIKGFKVAFLNYTYGTNGIGIQTDVVVDRINLDKIRSDAENARKAGAELIAACMHWGEEYTLLPVKSQKAMADSLTAMGIDMIIGSHPHVIEPMEMRRNKQNGRLVFLCYSLGNFISGMRTTDTRGGAMVKVTLSRDSLGNAMISDASYRLVFTISPSMGSQNFKLVDAFDNTIGPGASQHRNAFRTNALRIFDTRNINVPIDTLPISAYKKPYTSVLQPIAPPPHNKIFPTGEKNSKNVLPVPKKALPLQR